MIVIVLNQYNSITMRLLTSGTRNWYGTYSKIVLSFCYYLPSNESNYLIDRYAPTVMSEMMELGTDISAVFGEVMSIFLQR